MTTDTEALQQMATQKLAGFVQAAIYDLSDGRKFPDLMTAVVELERRAEHAAAKADAIAARLQDPEAVHASMLQGSVAKITMEQCAHTHGGEVLKQWMEFKGSQEAIAAAEAAERERCLRIVQSVDNYSNPMTANDCAAAIRAGAKGPSDDD